MINMRSVLFGGRSDKKTDSVRKSCLTFRLDVADFDKKIEDMGGLVNKSIVISGNNYKYIIGSEYLSADEVNTAMILKAKRIDSLLKNGGLKKNVEEVRKTILEELQDMHIDNQDLLAYIVSHDIAGFGPISILMEDKSIEEIEINSIDTPISVYTMKYGRCQTNLIFNGIDGFRCDVNRFVYETDKELSEDTPIIDVQVGNARVHAQIKPYAINGAAASIRIGKGKEIDCKQMIKVHTLDENLLAFLWLAIESKMNIIIAGSPASGKTTMLSALISLIPRSSKSVVIEEEIGELKAEMPFFNIISLYGSRNGKVNVAGQVVNALRMRPDRIIIGEVRGEETRELFSGSNLGIPFMTTMHSNEENLSIIKKLLVKPMSVEIKSLSSLDLAVYMKQIGVRERIVSSIYEYRWLSRAEIEKGFEIGEEEMVDEKKVAWNGSLFFDNIAKTKVLMNYAKSKDISVENSLKEFQRRARFIRKIGEDSEFWKMLNSYKWSF